MGYKARYKKDPNFYIEGVSGGITTKTALLAALFNSTALTFQRKIRNFEILEKDIAFYHQSPYQQEQLNWNPNLSLTAYLDLSGKVTIIEQDCFDSCTNLKYVYVPGCTEIQGPSGYQTMQNLPNLHWYCYFPLVWRTQNYILNGATSVKTLYLPELTYLWIQVSGTRNAYANMTALERLYMPKLNTVLYKTSDGSVRHFNNIKTGCIVYVPPALETSDGGNREKLIIYLEDTRLCEIRYIPNFTAPDAVVDLSSSNAALNSVDLDFTTPASTNAIDFYEVWIDDGKTRGMPLFAFQEIAISGDTLSNLEAGTTYAIKIRTVDFYYNVSGFSNTINVLIGAGASNFDATKINVKFAVVNPVIDIEQNFFNATALNINFAVIEPTVVIS